VRTLARVLCALLAAIALQTNAAELTTATIFGTVTSPAGAPIAGAGVTASAPSGRYAATTGRDGRFVLLGLVSDSYRIDVTAPGYRPLETSGVYVVPGAHERFAFVLRPAPRTIASVTAKAGAFTLGSPTDTFTVSGQSARASSPAESASGLAGYTRDTVAGAIAGVPGIDFDSFANVIVRGGKVQDTVFDYDSVPIPQGLIAEPGGNAVGAQLGTTGVAAATVTLDGYSDTSQNALGGVVDEVAQSGTYPAKGSLEAETGFGAQLGEIKFDEQWATPDLRWRYALSATSGSEYFAYGDGHTFYPAEMGTYGLGFQTRAQYAIAGNVHFAVTPHDDLSAVFLSGAAAYQQYDSPYQGLQWSTFGPFPGAPADPNVQVNTPSISRGTYSVEKLQWIHNWRHTLGRFAVFQSQIGASANGPEWDDLSFPDGVISLASTQSQRERGASYDLEDQAGDDHDLRAGIQYDAIGANLYQFVPTIPQTVTSRTWLGQLLAYASDEWSITPHLTALGSLRYVEQLTHAEDTVPFGDAAIDPHAAIAYTFGGSNALRAAFDHTSVPPLALDIQRVVAGTPAPPSSPLAPETADDYTFSYERGGRTQVRLTYYADFEKNRIDVLPANYRSNAGENPDAIGIPTNAGMLRSHGTELWLKNGGATLTANYGRTFTSSVYQFAFNDLNSAAILAGHLFPAAYVPDLTATLSYEFAFARRRLRVTPLLSYESGFPYGNGTMVWIRNPKTGRPEEVPNDNYVDPGYNYYFLKNPALPFDASTNPYIATLGTPEGADPNTLRTTPQMLASLHVEEDLSPRVTAFLDVTNLFATATPTQLQGNPYLIGPPGYGGGNPYYAAAYGAQYPGGRYTLGNGVPTNDGTTPAVPWNYGRGGYVPEAYPMARTLLLRLRYRL